jgi:RimJ/RimL family protein N-acetyltransferase
MTTLRGKNVLLRPMLASDMPRQRAFFQDAELAELDSSSPQAYADINVEEFFQTRLVSDGERAFFAIEVRGEYVGYGGLMNLKNSKKVFELGIVIGDRRYWNRGYGKEIVKLLLQHGFCELDGRKIELTTHQRNERALACFSACGFTEDHRIHGVTKFDGQYVDMIEMSITREMWKSGNSNS